MRVSARPVFQLDAPFSTPSSPALGGRSSNHLLAGSVHRGLPAPTGITGCPACAGHDTRERDFSRRTLLKTGPSRLSRSATCCSCFDLAPHSKLRVLVECPVDVWFKNVQQAIELARIGGCDEVRLLTISAIGQCDGVDRVFSRVPMNKVAEIYRSCDVLLKLSWVEGM